MIRYTVVWHVDAQNQLAQLWLEVSDRAAVTSAAGSLDQQLLTNAESKGIEVEGGLREMIVPPLRCLFFVSEPDRIVKVLDVAEV